MIREELRTGWGCIAWVIFFFAAAPVIGKLLWHWYAWVDRHL